MVAWVLLLHSRALRVEPPQNSGLALISPPSRPVELKHAPFKGFTLHLMVFMWPFLPFFFNPLQGTMNRSSWVYLTIVQNPHAHYANHENHKCYGMCRVQTIVA